MTYADIAEDSSAQQVNHAWISVDNLAGRTVRPVHEYRHKREERNERPDGLQRRSHFTRLVFVGGVHVIGDHRQAGQGADVQNELHDDAGGEAEG